MKDKNSELLEAIYKLRTVLALYTEFAPSEMITEIKIKPIALDCLKHVLWRELQANGSFFGTNIEPSGLRSNQELQIFGIKFTEA